MGDYLLLKKKRFFSSSRKLLPTQGIFSFLAHSAWAEGKKLFFLQYGVTFCWSSVFCFFDCFAFFFKSYFISFFFEEKPKKFKKTFGARLKWKKNFVFFCKFKLFWKFGKWSSDVKDWTRQEMLFSWFLSKKKMCPACLSREQKKKQSRESFSLTPKWPELAPCTWKSTR